MTRLVSDTEIVDAIAGGHAVYCHETKTVAGWVEVWQCIYNNNTEFGATLREAVANSIRATESVVH